MKFGCWWEPIVEVGGSNRDGKVVIRMVRLATACEGQLLFSQWTLITVRNWTY